MKCALCGKEIQKGEPHENVPGFEGEYCAKCFYDCTGLDIKTVQARKRKGKIGFIIGAVILFGAYSMVSNIYIGMFLYLAFSFIVCSFLNYFDNYLGNDFVMYAAVILLPFFFNSFSIAYKLFLFGVLVQGQIPLSERDTAPHGAYRRACLPLCTIAGWILMVVGALWGAYNIFA